jgi:hypothetical protein
MLTAPVLLALAAGIVGAAGCGRLSLPGSVGDPPVREVTVRVVRSAAVNLYDRGVRTVAIVPAAEGADAALSRHLAGRLDQTDAFFVLHPAAVRDRLMKAGVAVGWDATASSLRWAYERTGVDAVVVARVETFRIEEWEDVKESFSLRGTGEYGFVRNEEGKLVFREKRALASVPLVCRSDRGNVAASYRVWETRRGAEVATLRYELSADVPSFCYRGDVPAHVTNRARDRLLQRLLDQLNEQFLRAIVPRAERASVRFEVLGAGADGALVQRNELAILSASRGDWRGAVDLWRECLVGRAALPAIHYNLAVAYRATGRLTLAETHLQEALTAAPRPLYRRALQEVRSQGEASRP